MGDVRTGTFGGGRRFGGSGRARPDDGASA
jgi:hypothetical protein